MRLRPKIATTLFLLSMIPLTLLGVLVYRCGEQSLRDGQGSHFQYMAQKTVEAVDLSVYQLSQQIRTWSRLDLMGDVMTGDVDGNIVSFLKGLSKEHSALVSAEVLNASAEVIASTSEKLFGQKFLQEAFFKKAIEGSGYISDVAFDQESQKWIMQFAFPVWIKYDGHGGIVGVLRVKWEARELSRMLGIPTGKGGYPPQTILLVRKDGLVIAGSESAQPVVFNANLIEQKFESARLLRRHEESFLIEEESVDKEKYLAGFSYSKGYQDFKGLEWGVVVIQNTREVFAPVRRLRLMMGGMGLLVVVGVVFISLKLSKSITAPILSIAEVAQQVAGGNLDAQVRYRGADEVGSLADNFNRMIADLNCQRVQLVREKSHIHSIITNMADALFVVDEGGIIRTVNKPALDLLGETQEEIVGKHIGGYIGGAAGFKDWVSKQLGSHSVLRDDGNVLLAKDGRKIPVLFSTSAIFNDHDGIDGIICLAQDITQRQQAQQELKRLHDQLGLEKRKLEQLLNIDHTMRSILDLNHLVDFVIDHTTEILEADKCSVMLMDPESRQLHIRGAKGLEEVFIKETRVKWGEPIAGLVAKTGEPLLIGNIEEGGVLSRENRPSYKSRSFMSVPIKMHNRVAGVINVADKHSKEDDRFTPVDLKILCAIVRQASVAIENADYYRKLEHLSVTDSLTGIYNHRYFLHAMDQEVERAKRYPKPLCLMMLDVDDFKSYNDKYGHLGGDHLLKEVSNILKENLRSVDIVCRYAGDEFVAILPETAIPKAQIIADKIRKAMQKGAFERQVTVSIGIAEFNAAIDRRDLVMKADQALYQSKRGGKNRVSCFY